MILFLRVQIRWHPLAGQLDRGWFKLFQLDCCSGRLDQARGVKESGLRRIYLARQKLPPFFWVLWNGQHWDSGKERRALSGRPQLQASRALAQLFISPYMEKLGYSTSLMTTSNILRCRRQELFAMEERINDSSTGKVIVLAAAHVDGAGLSRPRPLCRNDSWHWVTDGHFGERFRVTFTANVRFTLRISFKESLSTTFTSNANLHHVINFALHLSFTVHYFYT